MWLPRNTTDSSRNLGYRHCLSFGERYGVTLESLASFDWKGWRIRSGISAGLGFNTNLS